MTIKKILFSVIILGTITFISCKSNENKTDASATDSTKSQATSPSDSAITYYCPMDTEVVSDKPGTCSKCGMDLEQKK